MGQDDDILTSRQVADLFKVGTSTVKRWADAGVIPCFRTPGRRYRFRRADVEALLTKLGAS
ncbi:MAG: helix-turn-helix domain-containing protein [Nocardioides sp.]|uniref:helix-turn-helix domain-containing protein n=1 Tax=Nocardioides sp. TaxID=35761 RepID=UPI0039E6C958